MKKLLRRSPMRLETLFAIINIVALLILAAPLAPRWAEAAPIQLLANSIFMFRDTGSANDIGRSQGESFQFGADVLGGSAGTTLGAVYSPTGFTVSQLACSPSAADPNLCIRATGFNINRLLPWTLRFEKGPDVLTMPGPPLAGTEQPVPFPTDVTASGSGTTPTISWTVPNGFIPDGFRVNIFDKDRLAISGLPDNIHNVGIPSTSTSYTLPAVLSNSLGDTCQMMSNTFSLNRVHAI